MPDETVPQLSSSEQTDDLSARIEKVIFDIVDNIKQSYPDRWESVCREVLVFRNISACYDIEVKKLFDELNALESQLPITMRMVNESQRNLQKGQEDENKFHDMFGI